MSSELFDNKEIGWKNLNDKQKDEIFKFCEGYMQFLNKAKISYS